MNPILHLLSPKKILDFWIDTYYNANNNMVPWIYTKLASYGCCYWGGEGGGILF